MYFDVPKSSNLSCLYITGKLLYAKHVHNLSFATRLFSRLCMQKKRTETRDSQATMSEREDRMLAT